MRYVTVVTSSILVHWARAVRHMLSLPALSICCVGSVRTTAAMMMPLVMSSYKHKW